MQKTIKLGSVEITVQTAQTIRDELNATLISTRVQSLEPKNASGYYDLFGELCAHTVSVNGLSFDPAALVNMPPVVVHDAYEAYMRLPKKLGKAWIAACNEVDVADFDEVLSPAPLAEDADPNS